MSLSCEKTPSVAALNEKWILANVFSSPSGSLRCLGPRFLRLRSDRTLPTQTHLHLLNSFAPHVRCESQSLVRWTAGGSPLMDLQATVFCSNNTPPPATTSRSQSLLQLRFQLSLSAMHSFSKRPFRLSRQ